MWVLSKLRAKAHTTRAVGFALIEPAKRPQSHAKRADKPEGRAPAKRLLQHPAQRWREHRHQRHAHRNKGDHRRGLFLAHHVAHNRAAQHHGHCNRRLDHPKGQEHFDRCGHRTADACRHEYHHRGQNHRPAPKAVRDRANDNLDHRRAGQIGRHRELHDRIAGAEFLRHRG